MSMLKPPAFQAAFTLLELLIVIILTAILGGYINSRFFSNDSFEEGALVEQIISAARLTQQMSMNDSSRVFSLDIQANQIDLLADGSSINLANLPFPLIFNSDVNLSPVGNISFTSLGSTTALVLTVQVTSTRLVCFEASGYIHAC